MKTVKVITKYIIKDGSRTIMGVYAPDKIEEAIVQVRNHMAEDDWKITKDYKDCCNYELNFEKDSGDIIQFYTSDFILNELSL